MPELPELILYQQAIAARSSSRLLKKDWPKTLAELEVLGERLGGGPTEDR